MQNSTSKFQSLSSLKSNVSSSVAVIQFQSYFVAQTLARNHQLKAAAFVMVCSTKQPNTLSLFCVVS